MDLRKAILKEHSRAQCDAIVEYIGSDQKKFDQLIDLFLNSEYRVVQRAAWPMSYCAIAHPALVKKHVKKLIGNLRNPGLHDSVKRNTVRFLQYIEVPPSLQGELMERCFSYLSEPNEAVAIKAFSLTILAGLAKKYPDIIPELKYLIEEQFPVQTAAFKNRARKIIRDLGIQTQL